MTSAKHVAAPEGGSLPIRTRLLVAVLFALVMGAIALQSAFWGASEGYALHGPPQTTQFKMTRLAECISAFRKSHQRLPESLAALAEWEREERNKESPAPFSGIREGIVTDGWNRALSYASDGESFTLTSLGRNGILGGVGIDADITEQGGEQVKRASLPSLTFIQFLELPGSRSPVGVSGAAAVFAGVLCYLLLRRELGNLVLPSILTLLATMFVTYFMGILDIVKYH